MYVNHDDESSTIATNTTNTLLRLLNTNEIYFIIVIKTQIDIKNKKFAVKYFIVSESAGQ